ncbi:hypothetical protein C8F04DRAFT_1187450 [Mycena alexandri]|uniref:Uncharacterized protein n=1 Tax=Mycena alexandri TaxID=1745969 RepID=A0AAD6SLJ0_9AGAR|nr:hypothetical protein C8F04DRAFT_1187450 [Mycena alexandri]
MSGRSARNRFAASKLTDPSNDEPPSSAHHAVLQDTQARLTLADPSPSRSQHSSDTRSDPAKLTDYFQYPAVAQGWFSASQATQTFPHFIPLNLIHPDAPPDFLPENSHHSYNKMSTNEIWVEGHVFVQSDLNQTAAKYSDKMSGALPPLQGVFPNIVRYSKGYQGLSFIKDIPSETLSVGFNIQSLDDTDVAWAQFFWIRQESNKRAPYHGEC